MTEDRFLSLFAEAIGEDPSTLTLDTPLRQLEVWDSVAYLAVMAMVDEQMEVVLPPDFLVSAQTAREILAKARG
jgi:acyl carrier protein